jgi:hypothetical protein
MMAASDDRADALYGLPLEQFVAERGALAKALRAEGDRAGADEVRRLPKPTIAAWAVNVTVRGHPDAARALAEAARLLSDVQQELLAGGRASAFREASDRARSAVEALVAVAPASGAATVDKVRATLQAATVDPDVLAEVTSGRVVRERVASGFGGLAAAGAGKAPGPRARAGKTHSEDSSSARTAAPRAGRRRPAPATQSEARERDRGRAKELQARDARAARGDARRREKLRRAKEDEAAAEQEATAARRALEQVESALAERRSQLRDAEARVKQAKRRRERAEG